jgi:hypothetical protein
VGRIDRIIAHTQARWEATAPLFRSIQRDPTGDFTTSSGSSGQGWDGNPRRSSQRRVAGTVEPSRASKKLSENRRNALCTQEVVTEQVLTWRRNRSRHHAPPKAPTRAPGYDLDDPRRALATDRADPRAVLAQEADRAEGRQLEEDAQRDHLPDADRLPVERTAREVRPQEHGPRLVPAVGRRGGAGEDLGGAGRRVRRARGGRVEVAERRRDAGQGPVRGGKRRAGTPPTAGRWARRRAC